MNVLVDMNSVHALHWAGGLAYRAWTLLFVLVGKVYQSLKLENKRE